MGKKSKRKRVRCKGRVRGIRRCEGRVRRRDEDVMEE